jgi:nitroimidazol reductase NimA-like FMN-containing flavoprotein (pyridoxamine 5'-phosphate oxidase superfamily)
LPRTPELYEARVVAHHVLAQTANWWEPGFVKTFKGELERPLETVYFRISVDEISGHQGVPGLGP